MAEIGIATADIENLQIDRSGRREILILLAVCAYVALCRALRFVRRDRKHAQYPYRTRADFAKMTAQHAYEIQKYVTSLEFPLLSQTALQFALFKTYAIPTISSLLCSTRQLSETENAGRRYADTSILIAEFLSWAPDGERANSAIARMNYIHGLYQKSGKISNDDMLYTLSLFVLELRRWIDTYEWRKLTDMEVCAIGTLWKSIGDAMAISFEALLHGPDSFMDGLQFVEDLQEWAGAYESRVMVPNAFNHKVAEETTKLLLFDVPEVLLPVGRQAVVAMMSERLRKAMIYDAPTPLAVACVHSLIGVRKFVLRWLLPPRPYRFRFRYFTDHPDPKTGRYYQFPWLGEPWYVRPGFLARFSIDSSLRRITGRPYPDGGKFQPEGYNILEMGPQSLEKLGAKECQETKDRLMGANRGRCPFGTAYGK